MNLPRLRLIRKKRGLTQSELAHSAGMSLRQFQRIESGEANPKLADLIAIVRALEISMDDLLGLEKYKPSEQEILSPDEKKMLDAYRMMSLSEDEWRWLNAFRRNDPSLVADLLAAFTARLAEQLKQRNEVSRGKDSEG